MKTISEHIKHIHGKPHHIRKRVAFTAAAAGAGLLAAVWLIGSLSMGAFALKPTSFATSEGEGAVTTVPDTTSADAQVAGAAAAPVPEDANAPAHIQIVNVTPTNAAPAQSRTTIPF